MPGLVPLRDPLAESVGTEAFAQPIRARLPVTKPAPRILDGGDEQRLEHLVGLDANPNERLRKRLCQNC